VIARIGKWLRTALTLNYLRFFKPEGLLAAAGWTKDRFDSYMADRFCHPVPSDLIVYIFPFLESLRKQVRGKHGQGQTWGWQQGQITLQLALRWAL
jgi:hypothetical protein